MSETSVIDAKARLPSLIERAEAGEPVHIIRHGKRVAVILSEPEFNRLTATRPKRTGYLDFLAEWRRCAQAERVCTADRSRGREPALPGDRSGLLLGPMRYLLDTNVWSEMVRAEPIESVRRAFHRYDPQFAMAAPVADELTLGVARVPDSKRKVLLAEWLEQTLDAYPILPFDLAAAQ